MKGFGCGGLCCLLACKTAVACLDVVLEHAQQEEHELNHDKVPKDKAVQFLSMGCPSCCFL